MTWGACTFVPAVPGSCCIGRGVGEMTSGRSLAEPPSTLIRVHTFSTTLASGEAAGSGDQQAPIHGPCYS